MRTLWAQVPGTDPMALPMMALRRWFAGLTLSSPEPLPGPFGLWVLLVALGSLLGLVVLVQGPFRVVRQLLDVPGHFRLARAALGRLRRSSRLVAVLLGAAVLSWTTWLFHAFGSQERLEDLAILLKTRSLGELAAEQGVLAALTPLRDLCGLGDSLVLLVIAAALVFKLAADRWGVAALPREQGGPAPLPPWTTLVWGGAGLYVLYRLSLQVLKPDGLPMAPFLFVEVAAVPVLMLLSDALLFGWVLQELRPIASESPDGATGLDVSGSLVMLPAAALACLVALPARYIAALAWLLPTDVGLGVALRSLQASLVAGRGLIVIQGVSLAMLGMVGVLAWGRGRVWPDFFRLLRAEGGRLVIVLAASGLLAGGLSAVAYITLLSMPAQPWVLDTADSYAHYATLPVGLLLLAALAELVDRTTAPSQAKPSREAAKQAIRGQDKDVTEPVGFDLV